MKWNGEEGLDAVSRLCAAVSLYYTGGRAGVHVFFYAYNFYDMINLSYRLIFHDTYNNIILEKLTVSLSSQRISFFPRVKETKAVQKQDTHAT